MEQIAGSLKVTSHVFCSKKVKEDVSHHMKEVEGKRKYGIQEARDSWQEGRGAGTHQEDAGRRSQDNTVWLDWENPSRQKQVRRLSRSLAQEGKLMEYLKCVNVVRGESGNKGQFEVK